MNGGMSNWLQMMMLAGTIIEEVKKARGEDSLGGARVTASEILDIAEKAAVGLGVITDNKKIKLAAAMISWADDLHMDIDGKIIITEGNMVALCNAISSAFSVEVVYQG